MNGGESKPDSQLYAKSLRKWKISSTTRVNDVRCFIREGQKSCWCFFKIDWGSKESKRSRIQTNHWKIDEWHSKQSWESTSTWNGSWYATRWIRMTLTRLFQSR